MVDLDFAVNIASKAISSLKLSVVNAPDQIPALFLRKSTSSSPLPLLLHINMTLKSGRVSQIWKKAIITPIQKKKNCT